MAKDGTNRGGARVGSGRKSKALVDKINAGTSAQILELPEPPVFEGEDVPPIKEYLKVKQKAGKDLCAEEVYKETWNWLKERGCANFVNKQLIEQYALLTLGEEGVVSYGNPVPIPGSVSIALDANGEPENFYADGIAYYVINNNMGYDGDLELALIPESFRTDILKEELDAKGVLIENAQVELESFALLFEFDGDQKHIRHVLYNCAASRPGIEGKTNEESREVQTETLKIKATPLSSGLVKAKTGNTTDATVYNDWYKAVYMPTETEQAGE